MLVRVADAARNAQLNGIRDLIDSGMGPGLLRIYSGDQPADADDEVGAAVLLAELELGSPSAPDATNGVLTFNPITRDEDAAATGQATWARIVNSDEESVLDCDVSDSGGNGALKLNTVNIVQGGPVEVTSLVLTAPAGSA